MKYLLLFTQVTFWELLLLCNGVTFWQVTCTCYKVLKLVTFNSTACIGVQYWFTWEIRVIELFNIAHMVAAKMHCLIPTPASPWASLLRCSDHPIENAWGENLEARYISIPNKLALAFLVAIYMYGAKFYQNYDDRSSNLRQTDTSRFIVCHVLLHFNASFFTLY